MKKKYIITVSIILFILIVGVFAGPVTSYVEKPDYDIIASNVVVVNVRNVNGFLFFFFVDISLMLFVNISINIICFICVYQTKF